MHAVKDPQRTHSYFSRTDCVRRKDLRRRSSGVESVGCCSLSPVSGFPGTGRDYRGGYTLTDPPFRLANGSGGGCWRVESSWDDPPPGESEQRPKSPSLRPHSKTAVPNAIGPYPGVRGRVNWKVQDIGPAHRVHPHPRGLPPSRSISWAAGWERAWTCGRSRSGWWRERCRGMRSRPARCVIMAVSSKGSRSLFLEPRAAAVSLRAPSRPCAAVVRSCRSTNRISVPPSRRSYRMRCSASATRLVCPLRPRLRHLPGSATETRSS
jgi:hypothetical protein